MCTAHANTIRESHCSHIPCRHFPSTGRDCTNSTPSAPALNDLLAPNTAPQQYTESQRISPTLIQPNEESSISSSSLLAIPEDREIQLQQPHVEPFLSSPLSKEPSSSPAQPESLTVTRSGRIVRLPARYSD